MDSSSPGLPFTGVAVSQGASRPGERRQHLHHDRSDVDGLPALEEQVAGLAEEARAAPDEHLAALVALHRRLTIRSAVHRENRGHRVLKPLRPLFNEGVALARRLADVAATEQSRVALGQALTDRSMFLVAAEQYGEAYDDYREVVDLLG